MGLFFLMVREEGLHAVRVVNAEDELIYMTAWHEAPREAVGEAQVWMDRTWGQTETASLLVR